MKFQKSDERHKETGFRKGKNSEKKKINEPKWAHLEVVFKSSVFCHKSAG